CTSASLPTPLPPFPTRRSSDLAIAIAREAARTAPTLEALRALLENFEGCALKNTATRLVFADGNPQARIMFVGEAPGRDEDIEGDRKSTRLNSSHGSISYAVFC